MQLKEGEYIFAFLDDVYVVTALGSTRAMYKNVGRTVVGCRKHPIAHWQNTIVEQSCRVFPRRGRLCERGAGTPKALKSSGPQSDHYNSCNTPSARGWRRGRSCGMPSLGSLTCCRIGKSSSRSRAPALSPHLADAAPQSIHTIRCRTRWGHIETDARIFKWFRVEIKRGRTHAVWQHSPCARAGWV